MQFRTVLVVAALVVASVAVGSAAFTSGTVERTANVDVVGDSSAVTGLEPGDSSAVDVNGGELQIDFGNYTNAQGVNSNASYTIGNSSNASETYAFNITNNDNTAHDYSFNYNRTTGSVGSVTFTAYDSSNNVVIATDGTSGQLTAGTTAYVVVEVDTAGTTKSDDLSGTLEISAT